MIKQLFYLIFCNVGENKLNNIHVDCVLDIKANLGEGPIWSIVDQNLYWVDVNNCQLNKYNPINGKNKTIDVGKPIGCFAIKKT